MSTEPVRFVILDDEDNMYIGTVKDIVKAIEHAHYSGDGRPMAIYYSPPRTNGVTPTLVPVTVEHCKSYEDSDEWLHSTVRIVLDGATLAEDFLTIDGRA